MRLVIQSGSQFGSAFELARDTLTIGRGTTNDVVLADIAASRTHCQIRREGSGWVIQDLGSVNGTLVNGQRIVASHPLRVGDVITVGQTSLRVEESLAAPTPLAPQPVVAQVMPRPAGGGLTAAHWALLAAGVGGLVIIGLLFVVLLFRQPTPTPRVAVLQTPVPTASATTLAPPTVTLAPTSTPISALALATPTATATPTVFNPEVTHTPIPTPKPTETLPKMYPTPIVLRPNPKERFTTSAPVPFSWIAVDALRPSEMYRVQISLDPDPQRTDQIACEIRTRETYVTAPGESAVCNDKWQFNQYYRYYWWVQVVLRDATGREQVLSPHPPPVNEFIWAP